MSDHPSLGWSLVEFKIKIACLLFPDWLPQPTYQTIAKFVGVSMVGYRPGLATENIVDGSLNSGLALLPA